MTRATWRGTPPGPGDVRRAQALRADGFGRAGGIDRDAFDDICTHVLVEEAATGGLSAVSAC